MTVQRYSTGAIILHWLIAILVIVNWRIAERAEGLPEAEAREVMSNHFAIGMTILILTVLRLIWRWTHKPPPFSADVAKWEAVLARTVQVIFYVLLIGLPIGGWLAISMYGKGIDMFGLFTIPPLGVGENPEQGHEIFEVHGTLGKAMLLLILLHILGALKHQFIDKDHALSRMWFGKSNKD